MRNQSRTTPRAAGAPAIGRSPTACRRGFTIVELLVCTAVVAILCGMLLPALRATRESSLRLKCQANLHAIGCALAAYGNLHDERLPSSVYAEPTARQPGNMMIARLDAAFGQPASARWDGLGWLVHGNFLHDGCDCLYCPSHHGTHPAERYAGAYAQDGDEAIFTNYQYSGHVDRTGRRLTLSDGSETMIVTDGLRTRSDFNHRCGANRLFADLHTDWWFDSMDALSRSLPLDADAVMPSASSYENFWATVAQANAN